MAKTTTTFEWSIGEWSERTELGYVPVDMPFSNGRYFVPRSGNTALVPPYSERIPCRMENDPESEFGDVTYVAYGSGTGPVEILRIIEFTEE